MSTNPFSNESSSVDEGIHSVLSDAKEKTVDYLERWEDCVRQHPAKAVLGAVVAGAIIHRLPIRSILIANIRIVGALAPPALLAYGAAKLCEILQQKAARSSLISEVEAIAENPRGERF